MPTPWSRPLRLLSFAAALAVPVAVAAAPSVAHAGDSCKTVADVSSKVWKATPPSVKTAIASTGPFGATAIKALKFMDEGIKIWNKLTKDSSWKIGPIGYSFGEWKQGRLIGSTERMFVSRIPAVNPVEVAFHKLGNDGKVKVVICQVPEHGPAKAVKSFTVQPGAKKGLIKKVTLNKAKGNIITVVLHGKSVTKSLQYKVRAKMLFEEDEPSGTTVTAPRDDGSVSAPRSNGSVSAPR
ncbi:MAG: hypothetical protein AAF721_28250 [Myxococcota bacterium]